MKVLGLLQNAWSPLYAGGIWPRESWLKALHRSRSGQRLRIFTENCPNIEFWWDNTTPIVGDSPDSVVKPDINHVKKVLTEQKPDAIIAFGKQAEKVISQIQVNDVIVIYTYHPACRIVKNLDFLKITERLKELCHQ